MKTANVIKVAGIVGIIAGGIAMKRGTKQLKVKAEGREQAEIATELLERVQTMNYKEVIDDEDLEELLTDLHFFWNGARATGLLDERLNARVAEFELDNHEILDDIQDSMRNIPTIERHLINAAARLNDFLSQHGEAVR